MVLLLRRAIVMEPAQPLGTPDLDRHDEASPRSRRSQLEWDAATHAGHAWVREERAFLRMANAHDRQAQARMVRQHIERVHAFLAELRSALPPNEG